MATKKATTTKKAAAPKKTAQKATPLQTILNPNNGDIKSLRLASNESQAFLLISTDFDGEMKKNFQVFFSIILLGMLATMIYMAVVANNIAQSVL